MVVIQNDSRFSFAGFCDGNRFDHDRAQFVAQSLRQVIAVTRPALSHRGHLLLAPKPKARDASDPPGRRLCARSSVRIPYFRIPYFQGSKKPIWNPGARLDDGWGRGLLNLQELVVVDSGLFPAGFSR